MRATKLKTAQVCREPHRADTITRSRLKGPVRPDSKIRLRLRETVGVARPRISGAKLQRRSRFQKTEIQQPSGLRPPYVPIPLFGELGAERDGPVPLEVRVS